MPAATADTDVIKRDVEHSMHSKQALQHTVKDSSNHMLREPNLHWQQQQQQQVQVSILSVTKEQNADVIGSSSSRDRTRSISCLGEQH